MEGFAMDLDTAMEFYQLCGKLDINTKEERLAFMRVFVKHKQAQYIRDVREVIKGKRALVIRKPKDGE